MLILLIVLIILFGGGLYVLFVVLFPWTFLILALWGCVLCIHVKQERKIHVGL